VPALDHGLVVGDGVFESTKVIDGQPFALTRHLATDGPLAGRTGPLAPPTRPDSNHGIREVLADATPVSPLGKLRWWVTGGLGAAGLRPGADAHTPALSRGGGADLAPPGPSTAVHVVPWTRNERAATAGLKTTSYADNVIALAAAQRAGASEAIFGQHPG
jgi:branched-chain amino acid aminotransferase